VTTTAAGTSTWPIQLCEVNSQTAWMAEMAVPIYVIGPDADAAQIERSGDFAAIERGGPATMIGFEQQIAVVRSPR